MVFVPRCSIFRTALEIAVTGIVFLCNPDASASECDASDINAADFLHDTNAQKSTNIGIDITFSARLFA